MTFVHVPFAFVRTVFLFPAAHAQHTVITFVLSAMTTSFWMRMIDAAPMMSAMLQSQ
jgi:hypothetical protein